jgi:hypothetical protein
MINDKHAYREKRDTLLVCQRDKLTPTPAEAREFHHSFVRDFHYGLAEFTEEQADRALLDWWDWFGDDVLIRCARTPTWGNCWRRPEDCDQQCKSFPRGASARASPSPHRTRSRPLAALETARAGAVSAGAGPRQAADAWAAA